MRLHIYLAGLDPNGQAVAALVDEFEDDDPHIEQERHGGKGVLEIELEPDHGTYNDAQLDAITERVHSINGLEVTAFGPTPYVSMAKIAERINRTPQNVLQLATGERGPGNFPAPLNPGDRGPVWEWGDVHIWLERAGIEIVMKPKDLAEAFAAKLIGKHNARLRHERSAALSRGQAP